MDPEISPQEAAYQLENIRRSLRESGAGLAEAEQYVQEELGFDSYRSFVYYAQNGVLPERDPDQARARVGRMGTLGRTGRSVLAGVPFSDEIYGMFAGDEARDRMRTDREVLREDYPVASFAAEMVPGALAGLGGGMIGARLAAARGAGPLAGALTGGSAGGALEGALFGAGEGETPAGRAGLGAAGAVIGGLSGGLFSGALGTLSVGGRRLGRMVSDNATATQARRRAREFLRNWMGATDPDMIDETLQELGPDAVVGDAFPEIGGRAIHAARSLSRGRLDQPGGPAQRLAARALDRGERLASDVAGATDLPVNQRARSVAQGLRDEAQRKVYGPIDEAFGEFALRDQPALRDLIYGDPQMREMAERFFGGLQRPYRFKDFQDLRNAMRAGLRRMDQSTEAPIGVKEELERQIARLTAVMQETFGEAGDLAVGDRLWARGQAMEDAYKLGFSKGASQSPTRLDITMDDVGFGRMTPEGKGAFLAGLVDRFAEKMTDSPTGGSAGSRLVNEAAGMRTWVRRVLGDDAANTLDDAIRREQAFQSTDRYNNQNSLTALRQQDQADMAEGMFRPGVNRWEWLRKFGEFFTDMDELNASKAEQIGEALLAGDTAPLREILNSSSAFVLREGTGQAEGAIGAALSSPVNQWIFGNILRSVGQDVRQRGVIGASENSEAFQQFLYGEEGRQNR